MWHFLQSKFHTSFVTGKNTGDFEQTGNSTGEFEQMRKYHFLNDVFQSTTEVIAFYMSFYHVGKMFSYAPLNHSTIDSYSHAGRAADPTREPLNRCCAVLALRT